MGATCDIDESAANYIAMRAFGESDAFPSNELDLRRGLSGSMPTVLAQRRWPRLNGGPWRAYAAMHLAQSTQDQSSIRRCANSKWDSSGVEAEGVPHAWSERSSPHSSSPVQSGREEVRSAAVETVAFLVITPRIDSHGHYEQSAESDPAQAALSGSHRKAPALPGDNLQIHFFTLCDSMQRGGKICKIRFRVRCIQRALPPLRILKCLFCLSCIYNTSPNVPESFGVRSGVVCFPDSCRCPIWCPLLCQS